MRTSPAAAFASICLVALGLAWTALWNGYPMVFSGDTGAYIEGGIISVDRHWLSVAWSRPPFYNLFLYLTQWRWSLWPTVFAQGLLLSHLLWLVHKTVHGEVVAARFLATGLALICLSTAPWFVGLLLPDFFTAVVVLALFVIGYGRPALGRAEYAYVWLLAVAAIMTHYSHVSLAAGLLVVVIGLRVLYEGLRGLLRREHLFHAAALASAVFALFAVQKVFQGEKGFAPYKDVFILARLIGDGTALDTLRTRCPEAGFRLCGQIDRIEVRPDDPYTMSDRFLWAADSPLYSVGVKAVRDEAPAIIRATLQDHAARQFGLSLRNWGTQLLAQDTGSWLEPFGTQDGDGTTRVIRTYYPSELDAFLGARQNTGELHLDLFAPLHVAVTALALLIGAGLALRHRKERYGTLSPLFLFLLAALLGNSLTSGILSRPDDRYMSRLTWVLVLYVALALNRRVGRLR
ncbi:hypothetical protein [Methyloversatilis thermotolerans]|uniref:hypothetical protein n=1 Tax=Methyloversatilis thermotolerans TaxID=1346290 RepID=UPI00036D6E3F|nr:hypothetical protein [Methyloversatilis thermotolerans]